MRCGSSAPPPAAREVTEIHWNLDAAEKHLAAGRLIEAREVAEKLRMPTATLATAGR